MLCVDVKYGRTLQNRTVHYRDVTKESSHISHERGRKIILLLSPSQTASGLVRQSSDGQCSLKWWLCFGTANINVSH